MSSRAGRLPDSPSEHTLHASPELPLEATERLFSGLVRAAARDPAAHAQVLMTLETYGLSAEQRLAFLRLFEGARAL